MTLKNPYWLRSGFLNVIQNFSGVIFGFGSFFFLIRILDKHSFGAWTLFMSTITIFEVIRTGLIQSALIKYIAASDADEHPGILSASAVISACLTCACILANTLLAPVLASLWETPELVLLFYIYNIAFLLTGILNLLNCIEQAHLKFRGTFLSATVRSGLFFFVTAGCFLFKVPVTLLQLVYIQIAGITLACFLAWIPVREHITFVFSISRDWLGKLLKFGKYAFGTSVSSILSGTIDQMMLGAMLSPAASGAFNIAVRITNLIDIPTNAMATIVFPQSAKRMETDGEGAIKYLFEKSVGTVLAILLPGLLFLYLFSDLVIYLIAGEKYSDTIPLLHVTLLYCLLIPYGRQFGTVISSIGKPKISFQIVLITAITNLVLNYFFIRTFGLMGAAYATLASNIIGFVLAQRILSRDLKVSVRQTLVYMYTFYPEFYSRYVVPVTRKLIQQTSK